MTCRRRIACCMSILACALMTGCASTPTLLLRREAAAPLQSSQATRLPAQRPLTVAVLPFARDDDPLEPDFARIVKHGEEQVRWRVERDMVSLPAFRAFDHTHAAEIVKQLGAQMSAAFDERLSKQLGQLLPADVAVFGKVRQYAAWPEVMGPFGTQVKVAHVDFTLSLVELETGKLLWRASHHGTGKRFLSAEALEFDVDLATASIAENAEGDKAGLADTGRLADVLTKEALSTLRLQ